MIFFCFLSFLFDFLSILHSTFLLDMFLNVGFDKLISFGLTSNSVHDALPTYVLIYAYFSFGNRTAIKCFFACVCVFAYLLSVGKLEEISSLILIISHFLNANTIRIHNCFMDELLWSSLLFTSTE